MTIKHIAMVLDAEGLDGPEKLLLIAYCNRTDDHGYCWPGQQRLADDCGTSIATVKRVKAKLIKKKLIASQRRLDPRTGEPITNLTRVNLELLAAMKHQRTDYDDNVIERITFDSDAPLPTKKKKAPRGAAQASDQVMAEDEPDPGLKMSPTSGQDEPDTGVKLGQGPGQVEPLTVSEPPEKPHGTVHPSVGSTEPIEGEGETASSESLRREMPLTEGVRFLMELGNAHPKLVITGKPLLDQGLVVDELFHRGWKDEVLWELLTRPLPEPLRSVGAVIARRLRDALGSPLPSPRRGWEDDETPTPRQYTAGGTVVLRRHYECDGNHGLCGVPVEAEGDRCREHAREPQSA
ncbi:helix-turn-helix domain-containing protein (plasmid) [Streptomyces hirsutus]|uniref:helix-turn-helix domain-containing protein n=1 Tax=Streptomyces hirsutus TaxID=35620 RepID=UPI002F90728F|nr:helix-turn-helix domain-containing protein [Streptomyces hirsutus]